MHSAAKPATKAEKRRMERARTVGCVACYLLGKYNPPDNHHALSGGRRVGHWAIIFLCPWHHRGIPGPLGMKATEELLGPSLAHNPRLFRGRFGSDQQLIALTDDLVDKAERQVVR